MHSTRSGVLGVSRKNSGRWRSADPSATSDGRTGPRLDMAEHDFAGTPPSNRDEIADAATDDQARRFGSMDRVAVGIEERAWKQAGAILERDHLTTVQVAGEDEIEAGIPRDLPDSRVVRAEHAHMAVDQGRGILAAAFGPGHGDNAS